jgi:hypothetical protein
MEIVEERMSMLELPMVEVKQKPPPQVWKPPGWVKVNTGGSLNAGSRQASSGFVINSR